MLFAAHTDIVLINSTMSHKDFIYWLRGKSYVVDQAYYSRVDYHCRSASVLRAEIAGDLPLQ